MAQPRTLLHYIINSPMSGNVWPPQALGFNIADVGGLSALNALPQGVLGLVWIGYTGGADATFQSAVAPFIGNARVYGFYLIDEPDITNTWGTFISIANLKAQSDYIHAHFPAGVKTFIVLANQGDSENPNYTAAQGAYTAANTGVDLFGIDPYPKRTDVPNGFDTSIIGKAFNAVVASGVPAAQLVPVYQAFGQWPPWTTPTTAEELQILDAWGAVLPNPVFDFVYSWGVQNNDVALNTLTSLQTVFQAHNAASSSYSYQVSYGPTNTGPWTAFGSPVQTLSEVITGLTPGTNYFFQVEAIDTITGLHSTPVRVGPFSTLQVTLTGISLSSASFVAGSGLVGLINVASTGGAFIGSLALSGTNAASFQILNGNELWTNGVLPVGTYNITITATMANAVGSPLARALVVTGTAAAIGPAVTGTFVNTDFSAVTGKTIVAELFGLSSANIAANRFAICSTLAFQNAAASLNMPLLRIKPTALGPTGLMLFPDTFRNGIGSPDWTVWDNFITNAHTFWDVSKRLVVGVMWTDILSGFSSGFSSGFGNPATITTANFASICSQTALHLKNTIGGDGNPVECKTWEIWHEPSMPPDLYLAYFNAAADALHAVDPTYLVAGPVCAGMDAPRINALIAGTNAARLGVINFHDYLYTSGVDTLPADVALATQTKSTTDVTTLASNLVGGFAANLPALIGEFNIEKTGVGTETRAQDIRGACFAAAWLMKAASAASQPVWGALREAYADGVFGVIGGSSHAGGFGIDPQGYFLAKAQGAVPGLAAQATVVNSGQNLYAWSTKNAARFALMLVNYGTTAYSGQVALSHWPVNTSGSATIQRWELSAASPTGVSNTLTVTAGLTASFTVPGQSVVILTP